MVCEVQIAPPLIPWCKLRAHLQARFCLEVKCTNARTSCFPSHLRMPLGELTFLVWLKSGTAWLRQIFRWHLRYIWSSSLLGLCDPNPEAPISSSSRAHYLIKPRPLSFSIHALFLRGEVGTFPQTPLDESVTIAAVLVKTLNSGNINRLHIAGCSQSPMIEMDYDGPASQTPEVSSGKCSSSPQITEKASDKYQGSKPTPTSPPLQSEGFISLALPWSTSSRLSPQLCNSSSPSLPISVLKDPNLSTWVIGSHCSRYEETLPYDLGWQPHLCGLTMVKY